MYLYKFIIYLNLFLFIFSSIITAQPSKASSSSTTALELPDISIVGSLISSYGPNNSLANNKKGFVEETELGFQGYLYPSIRLDTIIAIHKHENSYEIELEEAYLSFLELYFPGAGIHIPDISLKLGKKLLEVGKVNAIHPHHWNYVTRPEVLNSFFGDHGLSGQGFNFSYLLPLPFFCQWDIGLWYMPSAHAHEEEDHEEETNILGLAHYNYLTRLWSSFELSESQELEIGLNGIKGYGTHFQEHTDNVTIIGLDLTYRQTLNSYQRLLFQNEIYSLQREVPVGILNRTGLYSFLNYKLNKYWDVGALFDYLETPYPETQNYSYLSAILTHSLTEMTKARIQIKQSLNNSDYIIFGQLTFGIGPHSHPLE